MRILRYQLLAYTLVEMAARKAYRMLLLIVPYLSLLPRICLKARQALIFAIDVCRDFWLVETATNLFPGRLLIFFPFYHENQVIFLAFYAIYHFNFYSGFRFLRLLREYRILIFIHFWCQPLVFVIWDSLIKLWKGLIGARELLYIRFYHNFQ